MSSDVSRAVASTPNRISATRPGAGFSICDPLRDAADWDRHVAAFPSATAFHTSAWARVLKQTYGYSPFYLTREGSAPSDILVHLMEVVAPFSGRRGVSLPFTDTCPPLTRDGQMPREAITWATSVGAARGWRHVEFRTIAQAESQPAAHARSYFGHSLDLDENLPDLSSRFHPSIRQGLRKAERAGLQFSLASSPQDIEAFYHLQCQTRRRHGLPPQPRRFFMAIHAELMGRGLGFLSLVRDAGAPLSGVLFLTCGRQATYKFGASADESSSQRASTFAMWQAIRHCHERGIASVDFGRTDLEHAGLRTYKLRWGTRERRIEYTRFDMQGQPISVGKAGVTGWYNAVFRRLPLSMSRLIGTILYRYMG